MLKKYISILFISFVLFAPPVIASVVDDQQDSLVAVEQFLFDAEMGNYEACWHQSSELLQRLNPLDGFIQGMETHEYLFGGVVERTDLTVKVRDTMPKLPDGQYVLYIYKTKFERKRSAWELITVLRETDGQWRVVDYEIR